MHTKDMARLVADKIASHATKRHPIIEIHKSSKRHDDDEFPFGYYLYDVHFSDYYERVRTTRGYEDYVTKCPSFRLKLSAVALITPDELCTTFAVEYLSRMKRERAN